MKCPARGPRPCYDHALEAHGAGVGYEVGYQEAGVGEQPGRTYTYNDTEVYAQDGIQLVNRFSAKGPTQYREFQEEWQESKSIISIALVKMMATRTSLLRYCFQL